MKLLIICLGALALVLCGCESDHPLVYDEPLTSPGGEFATLPPVVQNSMRAEAGLEELDTVVKHEEATPPFYIFYFKNPDMYPPLIVAADGSVLDNNLRVVVPANKEAVEASTGAAVTGIKMDDLPLNVVLTIRHQAPMAEVDTIRRLTSDRDTFYSVSFKDPEHHPTILVRDDGRLVQ